MDYSGESDRIIKVLKVENINRRRSDTKKNLIHFCKLEDGEKTSHDIEFKLKRQKSVSYRIQKII